MNVERKDRGEKKKKGGRRRRRSGRRRINLFAVRWKTLPAIANFVGDNDEKRGEKKETERTKWMHGNGCESVLRNLPFESGLHGSPDLFSRLSSRSSLADFRFHRAVRTYTRVSSFARDNARLAATPISKDYQKKKKKMKLAASSRRFDTDSIDLTTNETRRFHEIELPFSHPCDWLFF